MKRVLIGLAVLVALLAAGTYLAFRFSLLPSVYVIRYIFAAGSADQPDQAD